MVLDADFMAQVMKIPYFKALADANGADWLVDLFDSLETDSYDFSQFEVPAIVSLSVDDAIKLDIEDIEAEPTEQEDAAKSLARPVAAAASPDLGDKSGAAGEQQTTTDESDVSGPRNFDNDTNKASALYYIPPDDHLTNWGAASLFYSARGEEEAVKVALSGEQETLRLSAFDDRIYTASADRSARTTVYGGDGSDTLYLTTENLVVDLGGQNDFGTFGGRVTFRGVENVVGSDGDDAISGDGADNKLVGRAGNDKIDGGSGSDTITGGSGNNRLSGGDGNDTITGGSGTDSISGDSGDDIIKAGGGNDDISGGAGDDAIDSGSGNDKISAGDGDDEIAGGAGKDDISGGAGDDTIDGGDDDDALNGGAGNDTIEGGTGDDEIIGDDGNDTIRADDGDDTVDGGTGNDTVNGAEGDDEIDGGDGDDTLSGDVGNDTLDGGAGKDTIRGGDGTDKLNGEAGADKLFGDAGNDTIDGGADDDEITGGDGDDVLLGGAGKDKIDGGVGADKITGGAGADTLTGGAGADTYMYLAKEDSGTAADTFDIITDFDVASDKFDVTALLANDTFDFIAAEGGAFTGTGAEVRWDKDGGKTYVEIDIDGNGTADMKIALDDAVDLTAANFTL